MTGVHGPNDKLTDYESNPSYERRVVVFYDVLGWRSHIDRASMDPAKIGGLRRLILQHSRTIKLRTHLELRASTFSDNVVITRPVDGRVWELIAQVAMFQIASAINGFLLRGGITIGDVVHDDEVVFGPGLNRAYELESTLAKYPRILLDRDHIEEYGKLGDLPVSEDGVLFLDPFRVEFVEYIKTGKIAVDEDTLRAAGLPFITDKSIWDFGGEQVIGLVLDSFKSQIRAPIADEPYEKLAWLYDRLADQLGVPPASSYPRTETHT
jgi:hypothetical protein